MGFTFAKQRRALALVALITISFAQAALFVHEFSDSHDVGESCEVCIFHARLGNAISSTDVLIAVTYQPLNLPTNYSTNRLPNQARTVRARSPPHSDPT